jgi:hypothetical protein
MQALRRIAQWVLAAVIGLTSFAVHVCAAESSVSGQAGSLSVTASGTATASPVSGSEQSGSFGVAMAPDQLDQRRGGDTSLSSMTLNGAVSDNSANRIVTGSNSISQGSFASASGLPTVIQNSGSNVLIQNATILNVHFGN